MAFKLENVVSVSDVHTGGNPLLTDARPNAGANPPPVGQSVLALGAMVPVSSQMSQNARLWRMGASNMAAHQVDIIKQAQNAPVLPGCTPQASPAKPPVGQSPD